MVLFCFVFLQFPVYTALSGVQRVGGGERGDGLRHSRQGGIQKVKLQKLHFDKMLTKFFCVL